MHFQKCWILSFWPNGNVPFVVVCNNVENDRSTKRFTRFFKKYQNKQPDSCIEHFSRDVEKPLLLLVDDELEFTMLEVDKEETYL